MRRLLTAAALVLLASTAHAQTINLAVKGDLSDAAITEASSILKDAGITLNVIPCTAGCSIDTPGVTLKALIKDVAPAPSKDVPAQSLATSFVDEGERGDLTWLYRDRIENLAQRTSQIEYVIWGRVLAHEIGHLLGLKHSHDHSLMRPDLTSPGFNAFSGREKKTLAVALK